MVDCTEAEGPGRRFALWFQGCPLRCAGCCNPEMLPFAGGHAFSLADVTKAMLRSRDVNGIEGISLLGGEPFAHVEAASLFAAAAKKLRLSVMVYSGYTLPEVRSMPQPEVAALLSLIDVLVDGPYLQTEPELHRRWVGSANQTVHFLTDHYSPADPCWSRSNTLEIRLKQNDLSINGFPSRAAVGLWHRPRIIEAT